MICIANILSAVLSFLRKNKKLLSQTIYRATPINTNNTVHTGANTQFGGLKLGLSSVSYHTSGEVKFAIEPSSPAHWGIAREIINFL